MKKKWLKKADKIKGKDLWNLDITLAKLILPRLIAFKKEVGGNPTELTMKEWKEIIDEMIYAMEIVADCKYFDCDVGEEFQLQRDRIQRGLNLFGKYFLHLWM
jgi:hypothetical protein